MDFEIVGEIDAVEVIAKGRSVRHRARLTRSFGGRDWRKMKGEATVVRAQTLLDAPNYTGMRHMELAVETSRSSGI